MLVIPRQFSSGEKKKKITPNHIPKILEFESQMIFSSQAMQIKLVKVWDWK